MKPFRADGAPLTEADQQRVTEVTERLSAARSGHIVETTESGGDHGAETFTWNLLLVCGDPKDPSTYFAGFDKNRVSPISCPDNITFDGSGNPWIATDGNALGSNDGLLAVPLDGPERGYGRQFLTVPLGAETCGPVVLPDDRSVFVAVQHPGEIRGATFDKPASTWPDGDYAKPAWPCRGGSTATRSAPERLSPDGRSGPDHARSRSGPDHRPVVRAAA